MTAVGILLKHLKKKGDEKELLIAGNTYTLSQIKLAEKIVSDVEKELENAQKKPKLSRRRAFIVVLEELYFDVTEYPEGLTLDRIHRRASQRFEFSQRALTRFKTPSDVHPKDPCHYYENDGLKMGNYKVAISHLLSHYHIYFEVEEAVISLKNTYTEILLC